jgi:hypothetical protein
MTDFCVVVSWGGWWMNGREIEQVMFWMGRYLYVLTLLTLSSTFTVRGSLGASVPQDSSHLISTHQRDCTHTISSYIINTMSC